MIALRPATERLLERLPGRRALWIALWALVPWLNAGLNVLLDTEGAVWEQSDVLIVLNIAALSVAVVISLWGADRIARRLEGLRATIPSEPFRELNSLAAPVVATAATAVALGAEAFFREGWTGALLRGATWLVLGFALWTFLWTYGSLQLGLDRLGRERLLPATAAADPALGLRPLGGVAFMGLWMLLAWLVPVVLTALPDLVGMAVGLAVLAAGLVTFFLSQLRLHRRMVEVKAEELAAARGLYAQAYEPIRKGRTLAALAEQHELLAAAYGLEQRAQAIHEWPVDHGLFARVATIATSVVAVIVARLILDPLGL